MKIGGRAGWKALQILPTSPKTSALSNPFIYFYRQNLSFQQTEWKVATSYCRQPIKNSRPKDIRTAFYSQTNFSTTPERTPAAPHQSKVLKGEFGGREFKEDPSEEGSLLHNILLLPLVLRFPHEGAGRAHEAAKDTTSGALIMRQVAFWVLGRR